LLCIDDIFSEMVVRMNVYPMCVCLTGEQGVCSRPVGGTAAGADIPA